MKHPSIRPPICPVARETGIWATLPCVQFTTMNMLLFVWFLVVSLGVPPLEDGVDASDHEPQDAIVESGDVELAEPEYPRILLAETDAVPSVRIGWIADGQHQWHQGDRPYAPPIGGEQIAPNLNCYVALGGTRIETGAGHPDGLVVRLGLTKIDNTKELFKDIDPGTSVTMIVQGIRLNKPIKAHEGTGLVHLKYALGDLEACSLPGTARNQYLMVDPDDTLGGRVSKGVNATPGGLDGGQGHGDVQVEIDDDHQTVKMTVRVPYAMFRHLQDPWESDLPGTFFEPIHLHAEVELIPIDAVEFDRGPTAPINDPLDPMD